MICQARRLFCFFNSLKCLYIDGFEHSFSWKTGVLTYTMYDIRKRHLHLAVQSGYQTLSQYCLESSWFVLQNYVQ
jgi:hypothetical protein